MGALITELGGSCQPLLPGYRVRILDGNPLAATQKRLRVTRNRSAGPLPGQSLAVLDPAQMLITDIIPCEDTHTQERALLDQILPLVHKDDVWIADRNFCTADFLTVALAQRAAFFVIRRHGNLTLEPVGPLRAEVETDTGWVSEGSVWICKDGLRLQQIRLIQVRLKKATEDGDTTVEILTNLPVNAASKTVVASLYLGRGQKQLEHFTLEKWYSSTLHETLLS